MSIDLNAYDLESLTALITKLQPGRSLMSADGCIVRKRGNTPGFDCGVGRGGYAARRANSAAEAAEDMLRVSAKHADPRALGGSESFDNFEEAIASVRKGDTKPSAPSPATKALRSVASKASVHSYRIRAQEARTALAKGEVYKAVRLLDSIVEHAAKHGNLEDIKRAQLALQDIRKHHEYTGSDPQVKGLNIEVRAREGAHVVLVNGKQRGEPRTRTEAEKLRAYLLRTAARNEDVQKIDDEVAGAPILVQRADSNEEEAA